MEDFTEFYLGSKDRVLRTVVLATGDMSGAEDAVAEAYARALTHWRRVRAHPSPVGWVLTTALNTSRTWWRRRRRESLGDPPELPVDGPTGEERLPAELRRQMLALPVRQRQVLALRVLADLPAEEVGTILGISAATVHVHLHRALATLRAAHRPTSPAKEARP